MRSIRWMPSSIASWRGSTRDVTFANLVDGFLRNLNPGHLAHIARPDEHSFIDRANHYKLATPLHFSSFLGITNSFHGDPTMHKFLATAAVFGLLGLPILASAQSTNQPSTKKESAANPSASTKKAAKAKGTKQAAKKGSMNRQAQVTKKKRLAMHGHKMRHATAKHGKRFAKGHGRHRQAGSSTATRMHQAAAKSRTTKARRAVAEPRTSIQRGAAYRAASAATQRNCGEFMYRKNGKCNDARNKPAK